MAVVVVVVVALMLLGFLRSRTDINAQSGAANNVIEIPNLDYVIKIPQI